MAKVNVKLTSLYNKHGDRFEFYHGEFRIDCSYPHVQTGFIDLNKFALDVLFEVAYNRIDNPEYIVNLFKGEDYLGGDLKMRCCKKPSEDEKKELTKNLKSKELSKRAKSLAELCLKNKKTFED